MPPTLRQKALLTIFGLAHITWNTLTTSTGENTFVHRLPRLLYPLHSFLSSIDGSVRSICRNCCSLGLYACFHLVESNMMIPALQLSCIHDHEYA